MKKLLTVLAILAIATAFINTTASAEMNLEVGAKGGVNMAKMWGDDADSLGTDTSFRVGFLGGAFLGAMFNETFGARLELDYAQRGQKVTVADTDFTIKLDYVEIALYAVGSFAAGEKGNVYVMGGPYVGFNSVAEISNGETEDIKDFIKSTDFGLGVGAGYGFMASDMLKIFLEGQYNIGLMSVDDSDEDLAIKNQGIGITAGVAIPLSSNSGGGM
jgi:opacity protein-like surface antigen